MRASSHGVCCGRFAALVEDDTESITTEEATDQESRMPRAPSTTQKTFAHRMARGRAVHEFCGDSAVRGAEALINKLAQRIGAVPIGGLVPPAIQRQRWSSLNVPIIWGAASPSILVEWLVSKASSIHAPMQLHGAQFRYRLHQVWLDGIASRNEGVGRSQHQKSCLDG